jgi:tetratricopeptide (TPR) repeat protein
MATISVALELASQHHQAGRLQAAEQIYRLILQADPDHADAIHLLGVIAYQVGKHEIAVAYIERAIALDGSVAAFHNNLGNAWKEQGKLDEAVACYRRALELKTGFAEAQSNLGNALREQGKLDEAVRCYRRALELKADFAEAYGNLGNALKDQGKLDEAVACYRRALAVNPNHAEAHNNLGVALKSQGKLDEAVACYRRAAELRADFADAHSNLGNALRDQGKFDEAVACCRRALELKPDFAEAYSNLGNALKDQGEPDEAVACCRRALQLKPDSAEIHCNLGLAFHDQGKLDEALACYRRAVELNPHYADGHASLAVNHLLRGDFQRGWPEYEWRWRTKHLSPRLFQQPLWDGCSLTGKTILLHAEQGLGDTLQFVRYAALVKGFGGTVILECQKPLVALLATCAGVDQLVGQGDAIPTFSTQAPLLSVPGILKTSFETIPATVPYLSATPALIDRWREKLREVPGYKIGINWQGRGGHGPWRVRNIPLQQFAALAEIPGVRLINLQSGAGREELARAGESFPVVDLGDAVDQTGGAFMDTAAIMMNLDLVITSDTALPHLAGSLGVPVWVALPFAPDWRWLLERADSPWYPTMRLFRQRERGNWQAVFDDIRKALCKRLPSVNRG